MGHIDSSRGRHDFGNHCSVDHLLRVGWNETKTQDIGFQDLQPSLPLVGIGLHIIRVWR